jgi:hypothetical protein
MGIIGEGGGMSKRFEIHTSCGKVFKLRAEDLDCRQISSMIEQNPGHPDVPELQATLDRRDAARKAAASRI